MSLLILVSQIAAVSDTAIFIQRCVTIIVATFPFVMEVLLCMVQSDVLHRVDIEIIL